MLAAGVWTGGMLAGATGDPGWEALLQPRRGHLLEMPAPEGMPRVAHGMMEMSYTKVRRTHQYGKCLLHGHTVARALKATGGLRRVCRTRVASALVLVITGPVQPSAHVCSLLSRHH